MIDWRLDYRVMNIMSIPCKLHAISGTNKAVPGAIGWPFKLAWVTGQFSARSGVRGSFKIDTLRCQCT